MNSNDRLIVALDVPNAAAARKIVQTLGETVSFYKIGLQLFTVEGPELVRDLANSGKNIFLDLKFHDIPNTVAAAVKSVAALNVQMLTVHASGGSKMLKAATEAAATAKHPPTVLAVTVLTSMGTEDLAEIGSSAPQYQVIRLAKIAQDSGCGGVVCSPLEIGDVRKTIGDQMAIVTPGVRPAGSDHGDQARVSTPLEAIRAGANYLVVGRPITASNHPQAAARGILKEISEVYSASSR